MEIKDHGEALELRFYPDDGILLELSVGYQALHRHDKISIYLQRDKLVAHTVTANDVRRELAKALKPKHSPPKPQISPKTILQRREIRRKLLKLLSDSTTSVWCRNGKVCENATHCRELTCQYKVHKSDVVAGCALCQLFVISTLSNNWEAALLLYEQGSVTIPHLPTH